MKHLRKFNESLDDCTFEDFETILLDILDEFEFEHQFNDYSEDPDYPFYDCKIFLNVSGIEEIENNLPMFTLDDILGKLPPSDSTEKIEDDEMERILSFSNNNVDDLNEFKNKIDYIVKVQMTLSKLLRRLHFEIKPRLEKFSNCSQVTIGVDYSMIRFTFDLPTED